MRLERGLLLADDTLRGAAWCTAHSNLIDGWFAELLQQAAGQAEPEGLALVAVGGYGRSELCPASDIDVMLIHERHTGVRSVADQIWYPVWDQGLHLSHSVQSLKEALSLAAEDLDTATALLSARHVAGDASLSAALADGAASQWERRSRRWITALASRTQERHARFGEVAFRLEPDLKEGKGGLRDVHALGWAQVSHRVLLDHDSTSLQALYGVILDARVELQRLTGRPASVLSLQEQPAVALALGDQDADALMGRIAEAARAIAWTGDDAWRRIRCELKGSRNRFAKRTHRVVGDGVVLADGDVRLDSGAPLGDPALPLRAALAAASHHTVIERHSLEQLVNTALEVPEPWTPEMLRLLVDMLLTGASCIDVIEALDQRGLWVRYLPEWRPVRARPQHNAYHLYTVDRHLLETVAQATQLTERVDRPDLLVIAALLHDIGKGYPGDHSSTGAQLVHRISLRLGLSPQDAQTISEVVKHHLLLPDAATRRDLDDPGTIEKVARVVVNEQRLRLLWALTEADSLATGPYAWSPWKSSLLSDLVDRVTRVLKGAPADTTVNESFPSRRQAQILAEGKQLIEAGDGIVTIYAEDRPGTFSRVAGVLALHGLDVLSAAAYSSDEGRALAQFRVSDPLRDVTPWNRVMADLKLALAGGLAVQARVAERARTYGRRKPTTRRPVEASVRFDNHASAGATVIEVHAPDGIGVLYRITRAFADLDLDIRSAKVQTMAGKVVDSFYVRGRGGAKITDSGALEEIERAVLHSLED